MLSGFDRAVGPVQPAERPHAEPYQCHVATLDTSEAKPCAFVLKDAGTGKTYVECTAHNYAVVAVDWTAAQFGRGPTLVERMSGLQQRFAELAELTGGDIDPTLPSEKQQRFADVFDSIARNIDGAIVALRKDRANGSRNAAAHQG